MKKRQKRREESLFWALADKRKKPDVLGYQPFDQRLLKALGFPSLDEEDDNV